MKVGWLLTNIIIFIGCWRVKSVNNFFVIVIPEILEKVLFLLMIISGAFIIYIVFNKLGLINNKEVSQ